ncbi:unnamed protein product [Allacma fusca]|uniref:Uncharacterized protein n=1 Tax=Allacma fusca TaxID=39272 RepID=A0A8J2LW81_9HEXA|nr:unnamed protein product [Allacma fusca]
MDNLFLFTTFQNCALSLQTYSVISDSSKLASHKFSDELTQLSYGYGSLTATPVISRGLENLSFKPKRLGTIIFTKYLSCYTQMYLSNFMEHNPNQRLSNFQRIPHYMKTLQENPEYVVIFTSRAPSDHNHQNWEISSNAYHLIGTTAKFLFVRNYKRVQLLCFPCLSSERDSTKYFIDLPELNFHEISETYAKVNQNLRESLIIVNYYKSWVSCSPLATQRFKIYAYACAHEAISSKLNFTTYFDNIDPTNLKTFEKATSTIITGWFSNKNSNYLVSNYTATANFEYVPTAEIFYPITFIWILQPRLSHAALWAAMDYKCWIFVVLTACKVIAILYIFRSNSKPRIYMSNIILSFLLDQGQLPRKHCLAILGIKAALIVIFWAYAALIISNAYKGALYSVMTSMSLPLIPTSLQDILDTAAFLVTTSFCYIPRKIGRQSLLHTTIDQMMGETLPPPESSNAIVQFRDTLKFSPHTIAEVVFCQMEQCRPEFRAGFKIPETHIFLGDEHEVVLYSLILKLSQKEITVLRSDGLDLFLQRVPFLIQRNFFATLYTKYLFWIVESGIWELWIEYQEFHIKLNEIRKYFQIKNGSMCYMSIRDVELVSLNIVGFIWGRNKIGQTTRPEKSLKLEVLQVFFVGIGAGVATALFIFSSEFLVNKMWRAYYKTVQTNSWLLS